MIRAIIFSITLLSLSACENRQYFSVVVWNKSGEELKKVSVWDDGVLAYKMGVFVPEAQESREFMYTPLSDNIKLTWTEYESGIDREVLVDMDGVIPEKYHNGTVQFDILGPDEVAVKFYFEPMVHYPPKVKETNPNSVSDDK